MKNQKYIGEGDIFNLGNYENFAGEHVTGNNYGLKLVNNSEESKVVALCPLVLMGLATSVVNGKVSGIDGYITADGDVITGLDDGEGGTTAKITAESIESENPLQYLLTQAAFAPFRIVRLELNSDQKAQFSEKISQRVITPFKKTDIHELDINLRKYVKADQYQSDRTDVPLLRDNSVLTLGIDTVIYFKVLANSIMEINMDIGAINNPTHTLRTRGAIAQKNVVMINRGPLQKD